MHSFDQPAVPVAVAPDGRSPEDGRSPRMRRVDARRNLEAILDAARTIFPERPDASMQDIAQAAGVHRATVHRHFAARDDLVTALRARAVGDFVSAAEAVVAAPPPRAADALEQLTAAVLVVIDHYRLYRFTTWRDEVTLARARDLMQPLSDLIAAGRAQGDFRSDLRPEEMYLAWVGLVSSLGPEIATSLRTAAEGASLVRRLLTEPR